MAGDNGDEMEIEGVDTVCARQEERDNRGDETYLFNEEPGIKESEDNGGAEEGGDGSKCTSHSAYRSISLSWDS